MTDPTRGMLRLARAGALTLSTVGLSLGAHVAAGGLAPTAAGLLLVVVPVLGTSLVVTARRLGLPLLGALFGLTQLGLHRAFEALTMGAPVGVPAGHGGMAGAMPVLAPVTGHGSGPAPGVGAAHGAMTSSLTMTAAHVVAAALTALLLARGERALWRLWLWLAPSLPGRVLGTTAHRAPFPPARATTGVATTPLLLRLRGPPRASALA